MGRSILMLAYYFPPCGASGTFRSLGFARHLRALGWDITVISASEYLKQGLDPSLLKKVPEDVRVLNAPVYDPFFLWDRMKRKKNTESQGGDTAQPSVKKEAGRGLMDQLTLFLKTPDNALGWLMPGLFKAIRAKKPSLIYSTAPPFTSHLIGYFLKKLWRVPLICDFRDPWRDNPFKHKSGGLIDRWDAFLEKIIIRNSDLIIANTDPMAEALQKRYPSFSSKISVLTNGFDPEDFLDIEAHRETPEQHMLLVHPGTLYGQRDPRPFLKGLQKAVHVGCGDIRVQLIGPSESFGGRSLEAHIADLQLEEYVEVVPSVRHTQALARMKGADMLLLFSQGTHIQVPAKIFEYMAFGKTIFSVCEPSSATDRIMGCMGEGHYSCRNESDVIAEALIEAYGRWKARSHMLPREQPENGTEQFLRAALTRKLERLMRSLGQEAV